MDIRKFFSVSSKSGSRPSESPVKYSKVKSRKRTAPVLSDSDSEDPFPKCEPTGTRKNSTNSDNIRREVVFNRHEESNLKSTGVDDFFGSAPVRRRKVSQGKTAAAERKELSASKDALERSPVENEEVRSKATPKKSPTKSSQKAHDDTKKSCGESPPASSPRKKVCGETNKVHPKKEMEGDGRKEKSIKRNINTPEKELANCQKEKAHGCSKDSKSPGGDDAEKRRTHYLQYRQYLDRRGPQALGSKDIPEGKPGCLSGLTFVITGVLESFERDEIKAVIEKYKGKVSTSLSKHTSYLVVGREPGPAKTEKAQKLGTKLLDENQLLELIATSGKCIGPSEIDTTADCTLKENSADSLKEGSIPSDSGIGQSVFSSIEETNVLQKTQKDNSPVEFTKVTKRKTCSKSVDTKMSFVEQYQPKKARRSLNDCSSSADSCETMDSFKCSDGDMKLADSEDLLFKMWVDKYKPSTTKQIIGQQGERSNMKKLQQWLLSWNKNHSGEKKTIASKWYGKDDGASCKAALLSGPPGIGKTTTAQLVCGECNFDYIELNASDTRSKKTLKELVEGTIGNKALINYASGEIENGVSSHRVIIMDEVDGMAGTQDRGGVQELISLIKISKIPIICICNDRASPKIRSLANYCYDLRFHRPRAEQIKAAMMSILYKENIKISPNILQDIIVASNQDIRQVLHCLSLWCAKKQLSAEQAKSDIGSGIKNVNIGPFDALRRVFSHSEAQHMSIHDKSVLFFTDYSLMPLFVQENYISVQPAEAKHDIVKHLQLLSGAADSICDGDLVERQIRTSNNWGLLPVEAIYASVIPGEIMSGNLTQMINFPSWLGKNSTSNHMKRILQQLHSHMRLKISANKTDLHLDQVAVLRNAIVQPLIEKEIDGIRESISVLSNYCLLREDVDNIIELTQWQGKKNPMSDISPKVKSAFTRTYNREGIMNPYSVVNIKKSRKKEINTDVLPDDEGDDFSDESSDDDVSTDAMVKVKKNAKKTDDSVPKKGRPKK